MPKRSNTRPAALLMALALAAFPPGAHALNIVLTDARSATGASAVGHLQPGNALSFIATRPNLTPRLDNDGSINNSLL